MPHGDDKSTPDTTRAGTRRQRARCAQGVHTASRTRRTESISGTVRMSALRSTSQTTAQERVAETDREVRACAVQSSGAESSPGISTMGTADSVEL